MRSIKLLFDWPRLEFWMAWYNHMQICDPAYLALQMLAVVDNANIALCKIRGASVHYRAMSD